MLNRYYSPEYIRSLKVMQEKVGQAIDHCEDEDQKEELIDHYNNIELELDGLKILAMHGEITYTKHTGVKPSLEQILKIA